MADVFLSYSHRDRSIAETLWQQLRAAGVDTFWDRDIPTGASIRDTLSSAIASAKIFVLLHPGEQGSSTFIGMETKAAITRSAAGDMRLIPVLMPGRQPVGDIGNFQYVRVNSDHDFRQVVSLVVEALEPSPRAQRSDSERRQSFLWSLLEADLAKAPGAAALVLDEIASTLDGGTAGEGREIDLLYRALGWAERELGYEHRSHVSLRYQLNAALLAASRFDESIELSRQALSRASTARERIEVGLQLGFALFQSGDVDASSAQYQDVLALARKNDSPTVLVTCLVALGSISRASGDLMRAQRFYEQALQVSERFAQPKARVTALIGLCEIATQTGNPEAGQRFAEEAVWLSRTTLAADDALTLRAATLHQSGA